MYLGYYSYDYLYVLLLIPLILLSTWAQLNINRTYAKFSQMGNSRYMTGADAALAILRANGIANVRVERVSGHLSDHYDPRARVIRLSDSVYGGQSIAAVGVAAHEAGHAVQYAKGYLPVRLRTLILPAVTFSNRWMMLLIIVGLLIGFWQLSMVGVILFGVVTFFQFVTLPVEFNASRRALAALRDHAGMQERDTDGAAKVLRAAALTYVAAFAVSLLQFLRFLAMVSRNNRRN